MVFFDSGCLLALGLISSQVINFIRLFILEDELKTRREEGLVEQNQESMQYITLGYPNLS